MVHWKAVDLGCESDERGKRTVCGSGIDSELEDEVKNSRQSTGYSRSGVG